MRRFNMATAAAVCIALAGCEGGVLGDRDLADKTRDFGVDRKELRDLKAGIWIDPLGCHHWIIDDGVEGYLSARVTPDGRPVCTDEGAPGHAYGDFKSGSSVGDAI